MSKGPQRLLFALIAACCSSCALLNCTKDPPPPAPKEGSYSYHLDCSSPVGTVKSWVQYTVTASDEPVRHGAEVTYAINAPIAQVDSAITTHFKSSSATFAVPDGFSVESVSSTLTADTPDFDSVDAHLDGNSVVYSLTGSFVFSDQVRPVPDIMITGVVTGPVGGTITWMSPTGVEGEATVGIFGTQHSDCQFEDGGGPIWVSHIE